MINSSRLIHPKDFFSSRAYEDTYVITVDSDEGYSRILLEENGCQIISDYQNLYLVELITEKDPGSLLNLDGIVQIRKPHRPIPCVTSEGVELVGADEWHDHGHTAQYVKIAIIDVGFQGLAQAIAAGELPEDLDTIDFTGYGMESLSRHGTAIAEIVHDMAPDAHLSLMNTYSEIDLGNAKDYCIENDIRIINHSVGYANTGGHDGTGVVCEIADDAADHGILWVNAIGNHVFNHYHAQFSDSDSDQEVEVEKPPYYTKYTIAR